MLILFIPCLTSCKRQKINIEDQILSLVSQERKEKFLVDLFESDQSVRDSEIVLEILKRNDYDKKSKEYQNHLRTMMKTDSINFLKIKRYLEVYGHPKTKDFSSKSNHAITTIAIHQLIFIRLMDSDCCYSMV